MNKKRFERLPEPEIVETVENNGQPRTRKTYAITQPDGTIEKFHSLFEYQRKKKAFTEQGIRFVLNNLPDERMADRLLRQMETRGQAECEINGVKVTLKLSTDETGGEILEIFANEFVLPKSNPKFVRPGEYKFEKHRAFVKTCRDVYRLIGNHAEKKEKETIENLL